MSNVVKDALVFVQVSLSEFRADAQQKIARDLCLEVLNQNSEAMREGAESLMVQLQEEPSFGGTETKRSDLFSRFIEERNCCVRPGST
jgi:hypothetical protein